MIVLNNNNYIKTSWAASVKLWIMDAKITNKTLFRIYIVSMCMWILFKVIKYFVAVEKKSIFFFFFLSQLMWEPCIVKGSFRDTLSKNRVVSQIYLVILDITNITLSCISRSQYKIILKAECYCLFIPFPLYDMQLL